MKIQFDTEKKLIRIEEKVNLNELFEKLEKFLPDGLWKEYDVEPVVFKDWVNPIIIKEFPIWPIHPQQPFWQPVITCAYPSAKTYNIQC